MSPLPGIYASQISGHLAGGPTGAYDAIASTTVTTGVNSVTFANLPTDYKHLQIRCNVLLQTNEEALLMTVNNDTSNNYFCHYLYGTGSGNANSAASVPTAYYYINSGLSPTYPGVSVTDVLDYNSTDKYKTVKSFGGVDKNGTGYIWLFSGTWGNKNRIAGLTIYSGNGNINAGSQISIYGVK